MADFNQLRSDPDFLALDSNTKIEVLQSVDADFAALSFDTQNEVINSLGIQQQPPGVSEQQPIQPSPGFIGTVEQDVDIEAIKTDVNTAASNVPKSGARFIEDLITPFLNPIDTAKAVGNLAIGTAEKLIPGKQEKEIFADQMVDFIKQRYGTKEAFKQTLIEDPVGVTADIASVVTGAGVAVKGVGRATKIQKISDVGEAITKAGAGLEPLQITRKITLETARPFIPKELPGRMFQSSAKFSTTLTEQQRKALTRTALDNEILPNVAGLDKIRSGINELNDQITSLIDDATTSGQKIQLKSFFKGFRELKKEASLSGRPVSSQRQIENIAREIGRANKKIGRKEFTPQEVQKLKQQIYKETESYYGKVTENPAAIKAQQAVARAAKESLEEIFPEIGQLNKKEAALIELNQAIEKSASRIANRDLLGIGVPIKGVAGGVAAGPWGVATGLGLGLLDSPTVKARLSIILNRLKRQGVQISPNSGFTALGLFQAGRLGEENE